MRQITVKLPDDTADLLEEIAADDFDGNRSEAVRTLLQRGAEYDEIRQERDRLERQYRQLVEQREEHTELVEYVQQERTIEQQRRQAGIVTRTKWWLFGVNEDAAEGEDE
jgi:metal-responsive CopG/Arc/MetJ family transcriptional regulator